MARTLLPVAGGVLGGMVGGPMGARIGFAVGSVIGSIVDPVQVRGPSIGDVGAQTSAEGAPRAIVYGTAPVTGNVIACGELVRRWVNQRGGGKGAPKVKTEHVYRTFAIRICEGPIAGVLRVWEDDKLVYDVRPESPIVAESQAWIANKTIYLGDEEQLPDPVLQAQVSGASDTPAYRGTAYIVVDSEDLTDRRGSIPQYRFEVAGDLHQFDAIEISSTSGTWGSIGYANISAGSNTVMTLDPTARARKCFLLLVKATVSPAGIPVPEIRWVLDGETIAVVPSTVAFREDGWTEPFAFQLNKAIGAGVLRIVVDPVPAGSGSFLLNYMVAYPEDPDSAFEYPNPSPILERDDDYFGVLRDPSDGSYVVIGGLFMNPTPPAFEWVEWGTEAPQPIVGEPMPLSDIVSDIADRCGVDRSQIDVSELADEVAGIVLAGEYTGADAIDVLRRVYFFDCSEHDGKVRFPKRGAAVVDVLTADDLVEDPETSTREQAIEYPAKLHLFYQHAASGYARVKATAQRSSPDVRVVGEASFEAPVVLGEDDAARTAHKMHKVSWADAEGEVKLSLPESFVRLVAADCVGLALRDRVRRLRIEELQLADGRLQLTARVDRQSAYTSAVTGIPLPAPTPPPGSIVGATVLAVLDIPSRLDSEDDLNLYIAVSAVEPAWYGALVERSRDGGANFADAAQLERAMVVGVLTADFAAASEHYTDTTSRVRLRLYRGSQELESITEQAFLSEGGSFAVQSPDGSWEVLQYLDADDLGDQEYELSTLHRGRLATQPSVHYGGALVVFLDDVEHVPAQAAWIGQQLTHRATSFGETTESSIEQALTYAGRSQLEWPIAYLALERDSNDVISGTWTPRHRFGSDDFPVPSINFIGYRVTIDDGSTEVVLDTVDPHFSFDASALASPVTVSVAALNRITGAGPATVDTV